MVHIEQLNGDWISKDYYPQHLGKDGYKIKFRFSDDSGTASVIIIGNKSETILYNGGIQIKPRSGDEFYLIIDRESIPVKNFENDRFIAQVPDYGQVTVYKSKVLGIRMSF